MDYAQEHVLTVRNYSLDDDKDEDTYIKTRVTIAPDGVQFIVASENVYSVVEGRDLKRVNVIMNGGNNLELLLTELDLILLERAVGTFFLDIR